MTSTDDTYPDENVIDGDKSLELGIDNNTHMVREASNTVTGTAFPDENVIDGDRSVDECNEGGAHENGNGIKSHKIAENENSDEVAVLTTPNIKIKETSRKVSFQNSPHLD